METKINIAEILKDKPKGTKLYSSACGNCTFEEAEDESFKISFYSPKFGFMRGGDGWFDKKGKLFDIGDYSDWEMIDGKHYCPDCYEVEVIDEVYNVKVK